MTTQETRGKRAARTAGAVIAFLVVFAIALPITWFGLGIAAGVAYLGSPIFMQNYWGGILGWIAQGFGSLLVAGIAGGIAATFVRSGTESGRDALATIGVKRRARAHVFTQGRTYRVKFRPYSRGELKELVGPYYGRSAGLAHMFWQFTSDGLRTHSYLMDYEIVEAEEAPGATVTIS